MSRLSTTGGSPASEVPATGSETLTGHPGGESRARPACPGERRGRDRVRAGGAPAGRGGDALQAPGRRPGTIQVVGIRVGLSCRKLLAYSSR